jgi:bifunctional N-acetylglucosamine-1-phosphate-uridyltransferase/glucosamine-1-phosphate-acetyltransferase GlmU-like protein
MTSNQTPPQNYGRIVRESNGQLKLVVVGKRLLRAARLATVPKPG